MILNNLNESTFSIDGILYIKNDYSLHFKKINLNRKLTVKNVELNIFDKKNEISLEGFPINCADLTIENNSKFMLITELNNYFKEFFGKFICGGDYWETTNW